jgi:hypothetical protein
VNETENLSNSAALEIYAELVEGEKKKTEIVICFSLSFYTDRP